MNSKAASSVSQSTHYADPSGLLSDNVSSAYDMARLIVNASGDDRIASVMRTPNYTVSPPSRDITFRSTNHLLGSDDFDVMAGKTGFISKSGYCLATLLRLPESRGSAGRGRGAGRAFECRPLPRDRESVQLAFVQGGRDLRHQDSGWATKAE